MTAESTVISRFKQAAIALMSVRPQEWWEWLFVIQHHGGPTRLLDWTESPLVGLYFAVCEEPHSDGALWVLLPTVLNELSNIRSSFPASIPAFGDDPVFDTYRAPMIDVSQSEIRPIAAIAQRNTRRMQAQLGVFTVSHMNPTPIESIDGGGHVWRYVVPRSAKVQIRKQLQLLQVTELSLFPELANVGGQVKELVK